MHSYVPCYGDLDDFRYEPLIRTKSRAYQIACWQGYLGTHEFFLGRSLRGWATALFTFCSAVALFSEPLLGVPMLLGVIGLNIASIRSIAATEPNSELYGKPCGTVFYSLHVISRFSLLWGVNFWKGQEPTDPACSELHSEISPETFYPLERSNNG